MLKYIEELDQVNLIKVEGQNLFVIKIIKLTPLQAIFPIFVKS